jgi:TatD DNase family protein
MVNFTANYVDTHCHLDLYNATVDIVKEAERASVLVIGVTNTPSLFPFTENLSKHHNNILPAIGLHPELAIQRKHELSLMWEYINRTRFIGEIGLDYRTQDQAERKIQRDIFSQIIDKCAEYGNKILTVHSRGSASDVIGIIGKSFPGKVIMHWFSGTEKIAEKAVTNGFFFSINSSMIKTKAGQNLILNIPEDRILTETDGPFIRVNGLPASPSNVRDTISSLSKLLDLNFESTSQLILKNFSSLLGHSQYKERLSNNL